MQHYNKVGGGGGEEFYSLQTSPKKLAIIIFIKIQTGKQKTGISKVRAS